MKTPTAQIVLLVALSMLCASSAETTLSVDAGGSTSLSLDTEQEKVGIMDDFVKSDRTPSPQRKREAKNEEAVPIKSRKIQQADDTIPRPPGTKTNSKRIRVKQQATGTSTAIPINLDPTKEEETTTKPSVAQTRTTTGPPTTATSPPSKAKVDEELFCLCDIHRNACDMNCCCDQECKDEDRHFFTHCSEDVGVLHGKSSARRQRSCYRSFVTFVHYTSQASVVNDKGMLCILRDNNIADNLLILPTVKANEIRKRIQDGNINIESKYSVFKQPSDLFQWKAYKYGSPIVGVKQAETSKEENQLVPFLYGLPAVFEGVPCAKLREPVRFLEPSRSECATRVQLQEDCQKLNVLNARSFTNDVQIISNPGNEKVDFVSITSKQMCKTDICSENPQNGFPGPTWNPGKQHCENVLVGLNLTFSFGLDGIFYVSASAQFIDLPTSVKIFKQEFKVNFVWHNKTSDKNMTASNEQEEWPRSGNPGYIVGKPVIMGKRVLVTASERNETNPNPESPDSAPNEEERILLYKDPSQWMTIHGPGQCPQYPEQTERKNLLFDYSHISLCSFSLTRFKYCEELQLQIAKVLLGMEDPLNFEKRKFYVAAFGSSDPNIPSQWVPVTTRNFPLGISTTQGNSPITRGCDSLIASLRITIAYAFVGSIDFPQAKITGVLYEPGVPVSISLEEVNKSFSISTIVTFKDVTEPPVMRVAKWPVLSITLPKDFFYPFSR